MPFSMKAQLRKNNYTYETMLNSQSRLCAGERLTLKGGFIPQHVCARVCADIATPSNYLYAPLVGKSCEEGFGVRFWQQVPSLIPFLSYVSTQWNTYVNLWESIWKHIL